MEHTKTAVFDCVYYFDAGCEDFVLAGVFTRLEDADLCKQTIEADSRLRPVGIAHRTLAALQKEFLDGAIADARRITLHSGGLSVAISEATNDEHTYYLVCRLCGTTANVPPPVDGGDHKHHQACCNDCGIEVCRLSEIECRHTWNCLMTPNV